MGLALALVSVSRLGLPVPCVVAPNTGILQRRLTRCLEDAAQLSDVVSYMEK